MPNTFKMFKNVKYFQNVHKCQIHSTSALDNPQNWPWHMFKQSDFCNMFNHRTGVPGTEECTKILALLVTQ